MIVVADTTPVNYLVLIGCAEVLPRLFGAVIIPPAVAKELEHAASPANVRQWIASRPEWFRIQAPKRLDLTFDLGERELEAIALAEELQADALLVDEKKARRVASARGLAVTGTLGIIKLASAQGLLDGRRAVAALRQTNFFIDNHVIAKILGIRSESSSDPESA